MTDQGRVPNRVLRRIREAERQESRGEFAAALAAKAAEMGVALFPSERYVARLEDGEVRRPHGAYRRLLADVCGRPFDELGFPLPYPDDDAAGQVGHSAGTGSAVLRAPQVNRGLSAPGTAGELAWHQIQTSGSWCAAGFPRSETLPEGEEAVRRRAFLLNLAIIADMSKSDPVAALEAVRRGFRESFPGWPDADVSDWNEIAFEYGETYLVTAPAELLNSLLVDFVGLQEAFRRYPQDAAQRELYRVSALLAGFLARSYSPSVGGVM